MTGSFQLGDMAPREGDVIGEWTVTVRPADDELARLREENRRLRETVAALADQVSRLAAEVDRLRQ